MALLFHDEPVVTYDLDIFCLLPEAGLLVSLPVEEKYRRFLILQRMVWETRWAAGKPCPAPWPDEPSG